MSKPEHDRTIDYVAFEDGRLTGGFTTVQAQRARIVREIFSFPSGRRFHLDPNGNELLYGANNGPAGCVRCGVPIACSRSSWGARLDSLRTASSGIAASRLPQLPPRPLRLAADV